MKMRGGDLCPLCGGGREETRDDHIHRRSRLWCCSGPERSGNGLLALRRGLDPGRCGRTN